MTGLNHTIVRCRDKRRSATFLTEMLGRPEPKRFGPFLVVELDNGVSLDFLEHEGEIASQHYAFLITEQQFDDVFARGRDRRLPYWPDPDLADTMTSLIAKRRAQVERTGSK